MDIYFLTLILLVISRLIVDTQTQISGILFFKDQEQDVKIWIRPQPLFLFGERNYLLDNLIAIINDKNGQDLVKFAYTVNHDYVLIYLITQQKYVKLCEYYIKDPLDVSWVKFIIHKSIEKIEYVMFNNQEFSLENMKMDKVNMIYSWQSILFSCQIYDSIEKQTLNYLVLQNEAFIKIQVLRTFNFRQLLIFQIFFKYQKTYQGKFLISVQNQDIKILIKQNLTNIIMDFENVYNKSYTKSFDSDMKDQWIQISLFNEVENILCQLAFKDQYFEQSFSFVRSQETFSNMTLFLQNYLRVGEFIENYKIYIINKFVDTQNANLEIFCFQNCKKCNQLQCLECEGELTLDSNCLCPVNQELHPSLGFCIDKTLTENIKINKSFDIKFCPFGQFYDQDNLQCTECPKLNEFYCTPCQYQMELWQQNKSCDYYDIVQQIFILPLQNYFLLQQLLVPLRVDLYPFEQILELTDQRRILISRDIYRILQDLCEQNYFYHQDLVKCKILSIGQYYGYQLQKIKLIICKIGYIYLNQCIKCQRNCLFCKFINHKLICILPDQFYTLGNNQQIIKCQDNKCQQISNQQYDECQIDNCMVCFYSTCLVCDHKYIQDSNYFCHFGSKYCAYLNFEINDNLNKPEYDYQQILYLRYQLEKFKINLHYYDIQQLILFANNFKAIRQDQLPQQKYSQDYKDDQYIYCLNQTQFNKYKFCHQHVSGYQYIKQLDQYVYCQNQNCQFDLIYQVTVLFTNKPSIKYKNSTFFNFQHFALSLSIHELFIKNIIIEAVVYVFDTYQNNCDTFFFIISDKENYNYQIILDFQGVSVFPSCQTVFAIDFNKVSLLNLFTYSSIQLEINCNELLIQNCTFYNQEILFLYINASQVQIEQIYIEGKYKEQFKPIFHIVNPQLIENVIFINLSLSNMNFTDSPLININQKVNKTKIEFINLQNITLTKKVILFTDYGNNQFKS